MLTMSRSLQTSLGIIDNIANICPDIPSSDRPSYSFAHISITQKGNIFSIGYDININHIAGWAYTTLEGQIYDTIVWIV